MQPLSDVTSVRKTLRDGVAKGYWTLEHLDIKPVGCETPDERFRNLLRDAPAVESVQAIPDPKDFDTVLPPSDPPTQAPKLPLTLDEEESRTQVQARTTSQAACDLHEPDELRPASGFEALPW